MQEDWTDGQIKDNDESPGTIGPDVNLEEWLSRSSSGPIWVKWRPARRIILVVVFFDVGGLCKAMNGVFGIFAKEKWVAVFF